MDDKLVRLSDVIETVENQCSYGNMWGNENLTLIDASKTIDELSDLPAVDAVEVRHGHYVGEYDGYADGNPVYDMWYCSECGCQFEDWDEMPTYKYCPACGARMNGRGEEADK